MIPVEAKITMSWWKTVLKIVGLGVEEYATVRSGGKNSTAITDGVTRVEPLVGELLSEIHPTKKS